VLGNFGEYDACQEQIFQSRCQRIYDRDRKHMRQPRSWKAYLWKAPSRHWSLVLCPASERFEFTVDSDIAHGDWTLGELDCFTWGVVLELQISSSTDGEFFFPLVGIIPDVNRSGLSELGLTSQCTFKEIEEKALQVVKSYKAYALIGTNCQHFAKELGERLDLSEEAIRALQPEDAAVMRVVGTITGTTAGIVGGGAVVGSALGATVPVATVTTSVAPAAGGWGVWAYLGYTTTTVQTVTTVVPLFSKVAVAGMGAAASGTVMLATAAIWAEAYNVWQRHHRS